LGGEEKVWQPKPIKPRIRKSHRPTGRRTLPAPVLFFVLLPNSTAKLVDHPRFLALSIRRRDYVVLANQMCARDYESQKAWAIIVMSPQSHFLRQFSVSIYRRQVIKAGVSSGTRDDYRNSPPSNLPRESLIAMLVTGQNRHRYTIALFDRVLDSGSDPFIAAMFSQGKYGVMN
jgi:hypothetical protein